MKEKVLLAEDDRDQAELIAGILEEAGYKVYYFSDADSAWEWVRKDHPVDLVITDIQMPGASGMGLCSLLRQNPATAVLPILMLSVLKSEGTKVEGFEKGADDYLTKPFSGKELAARVHALLRRSKLRGGTGRMLKAPGIAVDLDRVEVRISGRPVSLLPKEYDLLVLFLESRGRVLSHRHIAEAVWGYDEPASEDTLKVWISNLRKKLGPLAFRLETITGRGYRID